jgi:uncharacterized membrane protein YphA (DoxX/SURF4 family)
LSFPSSQPSSDDRLVRWLFLRAMGVVYLVAFVSLWVQVRGLIGAHGILPIGSFIDAARQFFDSHHVGLDRYRLLPTLSWLSPSDAALTAQCAVGTAAAALLVAGLAPGPCLAVLWTLYLSLVAAGQDFFSFQWDSLLLEAGLLATVLAPWQWRPRLSQESPPSRVVVWLLRWLVFRLMFESGSVKWLSGDPSWRHLKALTVHFQTQPLPTWIGWYAHQAPGWMQVASCAAMFGIEIGAPLLIFCGRRPRAVGGVLIIFLQVLILLTGNYTFFNGLTIALCVFLFDDALLARLVPNRLKPRPFDQPRPSPSWRTRIAPAMLAVVVLPVSILSVVETLQLVPGWLEPVEAVENDLAPLRSANHYGLFAVMTTQRAEIVIEGSDDRVTWRPYEFPDKPGDPMRRPSFVAPYQPRLDWQMWFAALGTWRANPWFANLCVRLLEGSPDVLRLLASNPFPVRPPRYIRAVLYDYRFTNWNERRATGAWWVRTPAGEYFPEISLR